MDISFDPGKRNLTLAARGLDFVRAAEVLEGRVATVEDLRKDYGEHRYISAGRLDGRMVVLVWTPRSNAAGKEVCHVISMRKANEREQKKYGHFV